MSKEELVLLDTSRDGVAVVRLNRPDVHNAFSNLVIERLDDIFEDLRGADGVRVVMVEGAGKSFSAGADLNWMRAAADYTESENVEDSVFFSQMLNKLHTLPQPTIAVVQGPAVGGGLGLVSACDMAFAVKSAWFSFSETRLGLIPAVISPYVIKAMGPRAAHRYFLTAERFDAEEAYRLGLLHGLADDMQGLNAQIERVVAAIFETAPGAVHAAKDLIEAVEGKEIDNHVIKDTAKRIAERRASDEGREGTSAFLEKRKPHWHLDFEA